VFVETDILTFPISLYDGQFTRHPFEQGYCHFKRDKICCHFTVNDNKLR